MAGISLILQNNPNITTINCGTSSPRLGGTVDISAFPNLEDFRCNQNDITALSGYENNSKIRVVQFFDNKVTGSIPSLSALTNLTDFRCNTNQLTGSIPSLSGSLNLTYFLCSTNQLTGSIPSLSGLTYLRTFYCHTNQLTGSIPSVSGLTYLTNFSCSNQTGQTKLTGPIPSLSGLTYLREFYCHTNQLTGSIPSLSGLTNLRNFSCSINQLTGPIPSLSGLTYLREFYCHTNQLTGFDGGSVSNTLGHFLAQNNQLTSTAVNAILAAFEAAGRTSANANSITPGFTSCILNLGGTNAAPTGQGLTDKETLDSRGWTVTVTP